MKYEKADPNKQPWAIRARQARAIFRQTFAETPLAEEMQYLMVSPEYQALMENAIVNELRAGRDGHDATIGSHLKALRAKGERFRLAAAYRKSQEYIDLHASPFSFTPKKARRA